MSGSENGQVRSSKMVTVEDILTTWNSAVYTKILNFLLKYFCQKVRAKGFYNSFLCNIWSGLPCAQKIHQISQNIPNFNSVGQEN